MLNCFCWSWIRSLAELSVLSTHTPMRCPWNERIQYRFDFSTTIVTALLIYFQEHFRYKQLLAMFVILVNTLLTHFLSSTVYFQQFLQNYIARTHLVYSIPMCNSRKNLRTLQYPNFPTLVVNGVKMLKRPALRYPRPPITPHQIPTLFAAITKGAINTYLWLD